jgi:hypothetical protein
MSAFGDQFRTPRKCLNNPQSERRFVGASTTWPEPSRVSLCIGKPTQLLLEFGDEDAADREMGSE